MRAGSASIRGGKRWALSLSILCTLLCTAFAKPVTASVQHRKVEIATAPGLIQQPFDAGRVLLIFAPPNAEEPLNTDVVPPTNKFFGQNVFNFTGETIALSGGNTQNTSTELYGWPVVSLDDLKAGNYKVQGFLNPYTTVTLSDGSTVTVHFPCGDGNPPVNGTDSLFTTVTKVTISGAAQTINLTFDHLQPTPQIRGKEIGGCSQGNYADTTYMKYVKIRSTALSDFWQRDMYVGANVLLPHGYDASDSTTRYPVVYSQNHWNADLGPFGYFPGSNQGFSGQWNRGVIPAANGNPAKPAPRLILVTFRHENPFYDDSYAVNTPNLGPFGDAINEELIPYIDKMFNTVAKPYARIQEGGSTGGWESAASLIFRPDLFGACFSSYPDSLSFHRHQAIHLYEFKNAYRYPNGKPIPSIRELTSPNKATAIVSVAQENNWELAFGTSSRSALQWDIWFAVYGIQGLNGYPLVAWDKVTGEIYPEAVQAWKPMDLTDWIVSNWNSDLNLGEVLRHRINVYVGTFDNYYLNEGVMQFRSRVSAKGGPDWANVTILPKQQHGGNYLLLENWPYLELLEQWVKDHAPDGKTPLLGEYTSPASRGNIWADVVAHGGRQAALDRQAPPQIVGYGSTMSKPKATVGRWDPGVVLQAQWLLGGKPAGKSFDVKQGQTVTYSGGKTGSLQLAVTGRKRDYADETRKSNTVQFSASQRRSMGLRT